ncbi:hypothetical protein MTsN4n12_22550 [Microbacterium sp. MTN4-12]
MRDHMERNAVSASGSRRSNRRRWTSAEYAYVALGLNGLCLLILFSNLLTGNTWWRVAVPLAVLCLVLGAVSGFQTRRLRTRERHEPKT